MDYFKKALLIPINKTNEILIQDRRNIVKKYKMDWGYFGGSIEDGETPMQAVIRETEEELGITLKPSQLIYLGRFDDFYKDEAKIERDVYLWFMGEITTQDLTLKEGKAMEFKPIDQVAELMILEADKRIPSVVAQYLEETHVHA